MISSDEHGSIRAQATLSSFDAPTIRERIETKPLMVRIVRRIVTGAFSLWTHLSTVLTRAFGWYPGVEPYVGYGTEEYSRLICRTVLAPERRQPGAVARGIRSILAVPAAHTSVRIDIDGAPLQTVRPATFKDHNTVSLRGARASEFAISDTSGYLDLMARHRLAVGRHRVSYAVRRRRPVSATLFTIPAATTVGVISDVDDTIMVTQAPTLWKAGYNMLLLNPYKRMPVPGMSLLYTSLREQLPQAPFFYLSTSPWNVEGSIRNFIIRHGYPEGPLLLRDLDPRPKTFVPSGMQHKLEFVEQLMSDFPRMRFLLIGDDGQGDPWTFAAILNRYPGRVIGIGVRQLHCRRRSGPGHPDQVAMVHWLISHAGVPVFLGRDGTELMRTMLPAARGFQRGRNE